MCMWIHISRWHSSGKELDCQCRKHKRHKLDPWVGKIRWRRTWRPTLIFLLENPMDREAWQVTVHRITKSQTWLKWIYVYICMYVCMYIYIYFLKIQMLYLKVDEFINCSNFFVNLAGIFPRSFKWAKNTQK